MVKIGCKISSTSNNRHFSITRPEQAEKRCGLYQLFPAQRDKDKGFAATKRAQRYKLHRNSLRSLQGRSDTKCNSSRMLLNGEEWLEPGAGGGAYA